ncbi:MAG: hypothetical protein ACXWJD_04025 [Burkholderiaceae bacterium]
MWQQLLQTYLQSKNGGSSGGGGGGAGMGGYGSGNVQANQNKSDGTAYGYQGFNSSGWTVSTGSSKALGAGVATISPWMIAAGAVVLFILWKKA